MFLILKICYNSWKDFDEKYRDRRTSSYPIVNNASYVILLPLAYYVLVKHVGPKLMEKRQAFELKPLILLYNVTQVFFNTFLFVRAMYVIFWRYSDMVVACQWPIKDYSPQGLEELNLSYCYFLLKFYDYLDTVFMMLRKRNRQISFLHLYHHMMISIGCFGGMRYLPGGHSAAFGIINCMVHMVMYFYYFLSALNPELKKSLWWKKYITQLQLFQFAYLLLHFLRPFVDKNCNYPKRVSAIGVSQAVVMLILFGNFYRRTYLTKPDSIKNE